MGFYTNNNVAKNIKTEITNTNTKVYDIVQYNVKSYGAVGNGVADDTLAIQAALDAVNTAGGGTVYFPKGIYLVSAPLIVYSNTHLLGQDMWNSVVKLADASLTKLFDCSGTATTSKIHIHFEKLNFKHVQGLVATAGTPTTDGKGVLIYANYTAFCEVNDCVFSDYTYAGIYLINTLYNGLYFCSWHIYDNIFNGNIVAKQISNACMYGIWCEAGAEYTIISGNSFLYMQEGVYLHNSPNHKIINNTMSSCNDGVKHLADLNVSNGKLLISGNTMNHNYNSGVFITNTCPAGNVNALQCGCVVSNNIILLPINYGIILAGGLGHVCEGNKIITNTVGKIGIKLSDNTTTHKASYCLVSQNIIQSNVIGDTGLLDTAGATGAGNVVTNNILAVTP